MIVQQNSALPGYKLHRAVLSSKLLGHCEDQPNSSKPFRPVREYPSTSDYEKTRLVHFWRTRILYSLYPTVSAPDRRHLARKYRKSGLFFSFIYDSLKTI